MRRTASTIRFRDDINDLLSEQDGLALLAPQVLLCAAEPAGPTSAAKTSHVSI